MRFYGLRPLTRLEAGLYGLIVAVLIALLANRLLGYMELAERAAMELTIVRINSGLNLRLAYALMQGRSTDLSPEQNPFALAGVTAPNFLGEQDLPDLRAESRAWVYDRVRHELIYLPRLKQGLRTADPDGVIRFRLAADPAARTYALVPAAPYSWD